MRSPWTHLQTAAQGPRETIYMSGCPQSLDHLVPHMREASFSLISTSRQNILSSRQKWHSERGSTTAISTHKASSASTSSRITGAQLLLYQRSASKELGVVCIFVYHVSPPQVLLSICSLLTDCNPADPLVGSIATQFTQNREEHDRIAKLWTKRYAT